MLRAESRFNDLPIIALIAHALVEEREGCLQAGRIDHVTKPIDPDALFSTLARWNKPRQGCLRVNPYQRAGGDPIEHFLRSEGST